MRNILVLITLMVLSLPVMAKERPNFKQRSAIQGAIHVIKSVLGHEHILSKKLDSLILDQDIYVAKFERKTLNGTATRFCLVDEEINISEDIVNAAIGKPIVSREFVKLINVLVHEGVHHAYKVLDPHAGKITRELLAKFLSNPDPTGRQPFAHLYHRSCEERKRWHDYISERQYNEGAYTLYGTSFSPISGQIGEDAINEEYEKYATELLSIINNHSFSKEDKENAFIRAGRRWLPVKRRLEKEWGVILPVYRYDIMVSTKFAMKRLSYKQLSASIRERYTSNNPFNCRATSNANTTRVAMNTECRPEVPAPIDFTSLEELAGVAAELSDDRI